MNRNFFQIIANNGRLPRKQKGAYTMFSAVLILILLTEMIIYAVQTGVFEQRKSANEMRQKEAFHIADSEFQEYQSKSVDSPWCLRYRVFCALLFGL